MTALTDSENQFMDVFPSLNASIEQGWQELSDEEAEMIAIAQAITRLQDEISSLQSKIDAASISGAKTFTQTNVKIAYSILTATGEVAVPYLSIVTLAYTIGKTFYDIITDTEKINKDLEQIAELQVEASEEAQAAAMTKATIQYLYNIEISFLSLKKHGTGLSAMWVNEKSKIDEAINAINAGAEPSKFLDLLTIDVANKNWDALFKIYAPNTRYASCIWARCYSSTTKKIIFMLATDESKDLNQKTWAGWSTLHIITASCLAVENTVFTAPDPKPDWFDALNSALVNAQTVAAHWVNDLSVDISKNVPTSIVDYGTDYAAFSAKIRSIADAHPDATGKDNEYVKQVNTLIETLLSALNNILTSVDKVSEDMKNWGIQMQAAHKDLTTGAANIQAAEADLQADISKMNDAIASLHKMIDGENKAIAAAAAAIGIGIFALIAGIALAFVTFGAGVVVAGAGAAAIVGGAVTWGVMQAKINKQYDEIAKDQKELDQDKRQLVALQGLAQASNLCISSIANATVALADFRASWGVFQGELQGVITKLNSGEKSMSTLVAETFTDAAEKEWNLVMEFAQSLLDAKVDVQKHSMSIEPKDAKAA